MQQAEETSAWSVVLLNSSSVTDGGLGGQKTGAGSDPGLCEAADPRFWPGPLALTGGEEELHNLSMQVDAFQVLRVCVRGDDCSVFYPRILELYQNQHIFLSNTSKKNQRPVLSAISQLLFRGTNHQSRSSKARAAVTHNQKSNAGLVCRWNLSYLSNTDSSVGTRKAAGRIGKWLAHRHVLSHPSTSPAHTTKHTHTHCCYITTHYKLIRSPELIMSPCPRKKQVQKICGWKLWQRRRCCEFLKQANMWQKGERRPDGFATSCSCSVLQTATLKMMNAGDSSLGADLLTKRQIFYRQCSLGS